MEHSYSSKNIRRYEKSDSKHLEGVASNPSLQPFTKDESSPSSNENLFYSRSFKKKRWFASPIPDKRNHGLTLSESFINLIMIHGKKRKAEKIFSQTLGKLAEYLQGKENHKKKETTLFNREENTPPCKARMCISSFCLQNEANASPLLVLSDKIEERNVYSLLQRAIDNVKPTLQVRKVRIARSVYQVPFIMKKKRQEKNAVRWIIESAKKKSRHSGVSFSQCLAQAVLDAFLAQGQAQEKRDQLHRTAEANRAFLRYRWW